MNSEVRLLFHEVADLSPAERERFFRSRSVTAELRAEVESLLAFDDSSELQPLTGLVGRTAQEVLRSTEPVTTLACGPYRLLRILGRGGMGEVHLAERNDGEIQQKVAIKLLRHGAERGAWLDRFLRERQLLAYLNHRSVSRVLDAGHTQDGRPYLVMEYVDGLPIDTYAAGKSLREQLELFLQVCEGVAHAHRHLIIHRDLKPSNILVDSSGQPKLLDFGIAKLVDETADPTKTVERFLTPNYASPEQLRGAAQTTATDIYSLGAVLYKLTTGRSPHESSEGSSQAIEIVAGRREIAQPKRLNPNLPSDIDSILRKSLRTDPEDRYASVEALANDIRAYLESRPVAARSGDAWYRARKMARRHWVPLAAAGLVIASLATGLYLANSARLLAERRFSQLRQLSNKVFDLDTAIRDLPGSIPARESLVTASLEYLQGLAFDPSKDVDLAIEVGKGYWQVARIQGMPTDLNLGQSAKAEANLEKADALLDAAVAARPRDRTVLLLSAQIAHDRMILAQSDHHRAEALAHAQKAASRTERLLAVPHLSQKDQDRAAVIFANIALAYNNMHLYPEAAKYAQRTIDLSRPIPTSRMRVSQGLSLLANALRYQGDLDGALRAIRDSRRLAEEAQYKSPIDRMINLYGVLWREGVILGEDESVSLDRPSEAIGVLQQSLDVVENAAQVDSHDSTSRSRVGTAARELGKILSHRNPERALEVFDLGIRRVSETPSSLSARRERALLLAYSSYPLESLHRQQEAKQRIDTATKLLTETGDYKAQTAPLDSELYVVLRARGDYEAQAGDPSGARQTYEELLNRVMAAHPDTDNDLRDVPRLVALYENLSRLRSKTGDPKGAESIAAKRRDLWQHWNAKLPNNPYVLRQLAAAQPN